METSEFNKIQNGDTVNFVYEVRYINRSEGWLEVSDEEDTGRTILYPGAIFSHEPLK
jgi:hypothetical protein